MINASVLSVVPTISPLPQSALASVSTPVIAQAAPQTTNILNAFLSLLTSYAEPMEAANETGVGLSGFSVGDKHSRRKEPVVADITGSVQVPATIGLVNTNLLPPAIVSTIANPVTNSMTPGFFAIGTPQLTVIPTVADPKTSTSGSTAAEPKENPVSSASTLRSTPASFTSPAMNLRPGSGDRLPLAFAMRLEETVVDSAPTSAPPPAVNNPLPAAVTTAVLIDPSPAPAVVKLPISPNTPTIATAPALPLGPALISVTPGRLQPIAPVVSPHSAAKPERVIPRNGVEVASTPVQKASTQQHDDVLNGISSSLDRDTQQDQEKKPSHELAVEPSGYAPATNSATPLMQTAPATIQTEASAPNPESLSTVRTTTPVASPSRTETATPAQPSAPPPPTREITMRLSHPDAPPVEVKVVDRAGTVRVAVRTADVNLTDNLQSGLSDLVHRLEHKGFDAEAWAPQNPSVATGQIVRSSGDSSSFESGGRDPRDTARQGNGGQQNNGRNRPKWVDELEQKLAIGDE